MQTDACSVIIVPAAHDDVIKWKHFPRHWPFVRGIHRSPVNSPHKGQWRGALMFSLICAWTNSWANTGDVGDLRRHRAHYDVIVVAGVNSNNSQALQQAQYWLQSWVWFVFKISLSISTLGYTVGLAQDCSISIANALEILQSCTKPSTCPVGWSDDMIQMTDEISPDFSVLRELRAMGGGRVSRSVATEQ